MSILIAGILIMGAFSPLALFGVISFGEIADEIFDGLELDIWNSDFDIHPES